MISNARFTAAFKASSIHFLGSLVVAALAAALVFLIWYPFPYREMAGGRELFVLVVSVDVICGPLLTAVLFDPSKPRLELWRDLGLVALVQVAALSFGMSTVWQARPLFLVQEVDRFKVIAEPDVDSAALAALPAALQPLWWKGPKVVAIREPKDAEERNKVMFESIKGGRDFGERPEFYLPYEGANALKSLNRAKPLSVFLQKQPGQQAAATELAAKKGADIAQWLYLPVVARQDWVAVLDKQGQIQGFLKGDGF
ncbi:MAG: pilus assembly protein [Polaromonas sp. 39-63-203]|nr:MAG: pilus assembly protein [Polaromonas sp. 35-63-240]OYZ03205.1 MAG: pilus assembly protein [Polaromonas sp. 28-63-22]OYZ84702.1 MAG: pilus assembly protein [Polaromonas sp. 24-62-144]OZA99299.1 MAG: pilus assembly protein [Polaromonas sp. 39-63-203]